MDGIQLSADPLNTIANPGFPSGGWTPRRSDAGAIGLAVCGFTFWVLADTVIKIVGRSSLPAYEIIAFLGLSVCGSLAIYAYIRREVRMLWPTRPGSQLVRSGLDLINNLCVVVALRHVSLTLFYILIFLAPLLVTILAAVFLGEKIGMRRAAAILAGFSGVVVAVNPFGSARQGDWVGFLACMTCAICFSVNMVWSRVLTRTESPESLAFLSGILMTAAGAAAMLWRAAPLDLALSGGLAVMGAFCAAGSICFFVSLKHASAATVSQYHYTQLVTGALITFLIWGELPTMWMVLGGGLIVAAGLYVALQART